MTADRTQSGGGGRSPAGSELHRCSLSSQVRARQCGPSPQLLLLSLGTVVGRGRRIVRALTQLPYSLLYPPDPPCFPLHPLLSNMSTTQFTQRTPQWALVQRAAAKELKRGKAAWTDKGVKKHRTRWRIKWGIREEGKDWRSGTVTVSGIQEQKVKNTVGGECKTENKREAVIAVSPERNRGLGVDYSKETDKAPLTAASSCFLRLRHRMTPPWCLFIFLIIYSPNCRVSAV